MQQVFAAFLRRWTSDAGQMQEMAVKPVRWQEGFVGMPVERPIIAQPPSNARISVATTEPLVDCEQVLFII
jgi:hypothetical protein